MDIRNTLLARMDYMNADDEGEIRLLADGWITVLGIDRHDTPKVERFSHDSDVPKNLFSPS